MKNSFALLKSRATLIQAAAFLFVCLTFVTPVAAQESSKDPLTNASIIKLVKAGFKEKSIIAIIHSRPNRFKLATEDLISLKHQGASENIILAMLSQNEPFEMTGEEWSDESFFRDPNKAPDTSAGQQDQGTGIFGSGGSSRSQSRSRGGNGGGESEGNITGSATVRIIRPPAEAGGGPAKLEKTPTLNNDDVVRLVEAGFSEGTIIKRIEQSPAEFDLSANKLSDLRRRRVTEPIIAAMVAAMGGDEIKSTGTPKKSSQ